MTDQFVAVSTGVNKKLVEKTDIASGVTYYAEEVSVPGIEATNYKTRLIKDPVTGVTIAETREQKGVVERQNWVYDASGVFIGVDAWVAE